PFEEPSQEIEAEENTDEDIEGTIDTNQPVEEKPTQTTQSTQIKPNTPTNDSSNSTKQEETQPQVNNPTLVPQVDTIKSEEVVNYRNDSTLTNYWKAIDEIANVAQNYYSENFSKTRVITKDGYLYNKASEEKIDVPYLIANDYLYSIYENYGAADCNVLLLKAEDLKGFDNFDLKSTEKGLTVFVSLKHPTSNMYLLTTSKSEGGVLTASQYASLLNNYYQNHGSVGRLYPETGDYNRILSFVSMYESRYENYFVRSITKDNKYATVVLSRASNTADIKQYILKKTGNIWEVVMEGIENEPRVLVSVNKNIPDFNLNILPDYTINDFRNSLNKNQYEIIAELVNKNYISSSDEIQYIAGARNFTYILLKNEVKYLCIDNGNGYNIVKVASSVEAENKMLAISKTAPIFIVLDK
ncbi:MAG: hypothetical protein ACRCW1_09835, partial [Anaerotignaceae bacterium]